MPSKPAQSDALTKCEIRIRTLTQCMYPLLNQAKGHKSTFMWTMCSRPETLLSHSGFSKQTGPTDNIWGILGATKDMRRHGHVHPESQTSIGDEKHPQCSNIRNDVSHRHDLLSHSPNCDAELQVFSDTTGSVRRNNVHAMRCPSEDAHCDRIPQDKQYTGNCGETDRTNNAITRTRRTPVDISL